MNDFAGQQVSFKNISVPVTKIIRDDTYQGLLDLYLGQVSGERDRLSWSHLVRSPTTWTVVSVCLTLSKIPQATFQITRRTPCILAKGGQDLGNYFYYWFRH